MLLAGKKTKTILQLLADILHCSRRHARSFCMAKQHATSRLV
ncbi:SgrR family transcriptional regulator [Xenorhabdus japonica]